jgi:predicted GNAT superfamily acetyltransferase
MNQSTDSSIEIRKIESFEEMDACVNLQQSVWQYPDLDLIPRRMFVVARAVGGQIFGAWDGPQLAGYALAIPGTRNGQSYLHSHMLAVSPHYRNRGIGAQLKFEQREDALARGIDLIEWTFDPLQIKNAHFNLEKLGAIVRRYTPDFYGPSRSPVHGARPTDRLHAEWWLQSKRVESLMTGKNLPEYSIKDTVTVTNIAATPNDKTALSAASELELLLQVRRRFISAFSTGLVALGFETAHDGTARYLLGVLGEDEQVQR